MADKTTRPAHDDAANYDVGHPGGASPPDSRHPAEPRAETAHPIAVLVAHGMGQQIQFQTLDDVAEGLCRYAKRGRRAPRAETVEVSGERLQRLDLSLTLES